MSNTPLHRLPWRFRDTAPVYDTDERLVRELHPHWLISMPILIAAAPLSLTVVFLFVGLNTEASSGVGQLWLCISMLFSMVTLHWFFHRLLSIRLNRIFITDRRILLLTSDLWFKDYMHEIVLLRVIAVEVFKHGILQNIFDYGDLWFDTGGSAVETNQIIPFVPHPYHWAKELSELGAPTEKASS